MRILIRHISVVYILIPNFFFSLWLSPIIATIWCTLLLLGGIFYFKEDADKISASAVISFVKTPSTFYVSTLIFIWVLFSGSGEFTVQSLDYTKHNLFIKDLITKPWPVVYDSQSHLNSYLAYYLPVCYVSKFLGISIARYLFFIWTFMGCWLSTMWFIEIVGNKINKILVCLSFMFFGTAGVYWVCVVLEQLCLYSNINGDITRLFSTQSGANPFTIGMPLHLHNFTLKFYYAPQHIIPSWLMGCWLIDCLVLSKRESLFTIGFIVCIFCFWSPFVVLSSMPFVIVYLFLKYDCSAVKFFDEIKLLVKGANIIYLSCTLVTLVVMALWYQAHYPLKESYFMWNYPYNDINYHSYWWVYALFFFMFQFSYIFIFTYKNEIYTKNINFKYYLFSLFGFLLILPTFRIGVWNDSLMNMSFVPMTFFAFLIIQSYADIWQQKKVIALGFIFIWYLSAAISLSSDSHIVNLRERHLKLSRHYIDNPYHIENIRYTMYDESSKLEAIYIYKRQCLGSNNSLFGTYLIKR